MRSIRLPVPRFVYGGLALALGALAFALGIREGRFDAARHRSGSRFLDGGLLRPRRRLALAYTIDQYLLLLRLPGRERFLAGTDRGSVMRTACRILNLPEDTFVQNLLHAEGKRIWCGGRRGSWFGSVLGGTTVIALGAAAALEARRISTGVCIVWGLEASPSPRGSERAAFRGSVPPGSRRRKSSDVRAPGWDSAAQAARIRVTEGSLITDEGARVLYGAAVAWPEAPVELPLASSWTERELAEDAASRVAKIAPWRRA